MFWFTIWLLCWYMGIWIDNFDPSTQHDWNKMNKYSKFAFAWLCSNATGVYLIVVFPKILMAYMN